MFNLDKCLDSVSLVLPDQFPLKDFIHQNTLQAFQWQTFHEALQSASSVYGANCYMETTFYGEAFRAGRISPKGISKALREHFANEAEMLIFQQKMFDLIDGSLDVKPLGQAVCGLRQMWLAEIGLDIDKRAQPIIFKILGNYLDQGISIWRLPHIHLDFWECIGKIIEESSLPIKPLTDKECRKLFKLEPEDVVLHCLQKIVGDEALFQTYITEMLLTHPGWAGMVRVIEKHPDFLHSRRTLRLKHLLALELCFELGWLYRKKSLTFRPVSEYAGVVEKFSNSKTMIKKHSEILFVKKLWHSSYEWSYYDEAIDSIQNSLRRKSFKPQSTKVQVLFCLDDRSCSIRRHLESFDPQIETFGTPGFFGIDFLYQSLHSQRPAKHCPLPVKPKHMVREVSRENAHLKKRIRMPSQMNGHKANTLFRGWLITQVFGAFAAIRLAFAVFQPFLRFAVLNKKISTHRTDLEILRVNEDLNDQGFYAGYSYFEMAERVRSVLKSIGMTEEFAPLVILLAHGSSSVNNPHFAAYDCGACSGKHGSPNSRSFAWMANQSEVREILRDSGISIPDETRFVPAMHNTTTDEVSYFDVEHLSVEQRAIFKHFREKMHQALDHNAKERCKKFELVSTKISPSAARKHVKLRSAAIFEPRPEMNHANNALCIVGKRSLTKGVFLDRRAFLQSYDAATDLEGDTLAAILGAVVPVCGGINLEYFFSRVDSNVYGAGSKLPHNINGLVGVTNGVQGDLRTGLPSQMTEMHEPVRLMIVVEHSPEVALKAARKSPEIFQWIENEWIRYAAIDPNTEECFIWQGSEFKKRSETGGEGLV